MRFRSSWRGKPWVRREKREPQKRERRDVDNPGQRRQLGRKSSWGGGYWGEMLERCTSPKPAGFVHLRTPEACPSRGHRVGQGCSVGLPAAAAPPARSGDKRPFFSRAGEEVACLHGRERGWPRSCRKGAGVWKDVRVRGRLRVSGAACSGKACPRVELRSVKCMDTGGVTLNCRCVTCLAGARR